MRVRVLRRSSPDGEERWESFDYDGPTDTTVAEVLDYLNYHDDIVDERGERTSRINWECSCLQGICGACAMVINGVPALACETFLRDLRGDELTLRPLRKFPVVRDLVVDRSSIQDNLTKASVYIGEYHPAPNNDVGQQYAAAKCLKCGLCLEVCPNYVDGRTFLGATFANDCYLVASRNATRAAEVKGLYARGFGRGCSKALSCMEVCPMGIPLVAMIAKLNR